MHEIGTIHAVSANKKAVAERQFQPMAVQVADGLKAAWRVESANKSTVLSCQEKIKWLFLVQMNTFIPLFTLLIVLMPLNDLPINENTDKRVKFPRPCCPATVILYIHHVCIRPLASKSYFFSTYPNLFVFLFHFIFI